MFENWKPTAERERLIENHARRANWKRWGPYLSERQWGTIREDYSPDGSCWTYFPHEQARSRAYRWGEDGLLGISDRKGRLAFALALWNGKDPFLKERLFGLTPPETNHGEDVKEYYFYTHSTPTHSYMRAVYKYPQEEFPYRQLVDVSSKRKRSEPEYELADTGIFNTNRYFDVIAEYAKNGPNDIAILIRVENRGPAAAPCVIIPQLWFRNTWSWGRTGEGYYPRPNAELLQNGFIRAVHSELGAYLLAADPAAPPAEVLFTDNETNFEKLFGYRNNHRYSKDAFHEYIVDGKRSAVNPAKNGTKCGLLYRAQIDPGEALELKLRLFAEPEQPAELFGAAFDEVFVRRAAECEDFYATSCRSDLEPHERIVYDQAYAGLLWSKQFYYYAVKEWREGDPAQPAPAPSRADVRNVGWDHLYNRDVISMPDKWEYPWYAAWDLAFHMLPFARVDPEFAKRQLVLLLREWYMHPNGQIPAYEFSFSDVNPPVHAWACWRVYKMSGSPGNRDPEFLARVFHKLLLNFTWWINRKDVKGNNLFSGGFLGLDNIGVFDRGAPQSLGGSLEQADATAWMAFYCGTMLSMALELARYDRAYDDVASKFFEHFVAITDAMNSFGGSGLWDSQDNFYYDRLHLEDRDVPMKVRSLVGLIPLCAVEVISDDIVDALPAFKRRALWFLREKREIARYVTYMEHTGSSGGGKSLLAVPSRRRLEHMLRYMLDENEFLSPFGIRSLSKIHQNQPFVLHAAGQEYRINYEPAESQTELFGGNSNWRGPIWFPINYLIIEALERYHYFYGDSLLVECPTGSGRMANLAQVSRELCRRLVSLFVPDANGVCPYHGNDALFSKDKHWSSLHLFYEHFHGDTGRGLGASHQTGWTALVALCVEKLARTRGLPS